MKLVTVLLLVALIAFPANAGPIATNFDGPVSTDITHAFPGLTFLAPLIGTGPVRTYASSSADTPGNLLGLSGQNNFFTFNQSNGAIDVVFDEPVSFVSVRAAFSIGTDFFLGIGGLPFMAVYNSPTIAAANRIGLVTWDIPGDPCLSGNFCLSAFDTLEFTSASRDIKAIRLTGSLSTQGGPSRQARFDTLTFDTAVSASAGALVDLNGDMSGDAFIYSALTGNWAIQNAVAAGGFTGTNGAWSPGWSVTNARFNADALTDLFLFNETSGQWFKMLNNGTGGFTSGGNGFWASGWRRVVADLDGDSLSDVFLWDAGTGTWFKSLSTPSGFNYIQGFWSPGWELYPARLNGDALQDFLLFNRTSGQWFLTLGAAGTGFSYPQSGFWSTDWQIYPGDYSGDGISDLLLHRPASGLWFVATSGAGSFSYTSGFFSIGWALYPMDLDANGRTDLFMHNGATGQWFELLSNGSGAFAVGGNSFWSLGWNLYPTDFNGDGRGDILLYNPVTGSWVQARNLTLGTFSYSSGIWDAGLTIVAGAFVP